MPGFCLRKVIRPGTDFTGRLGWTTSTFGTTEICETGSTEVLDDIRKKWPPTVRQLLSVTGLGPKRVKRLVEALANTADRGAHYYCVIVLVRHATDPEPIIAEGRWHGEVVATPSGAGGFGYDPYFLLPDLGKTAAALMPDEKNAISHRGRALAQLVAQLRVMDYAK